MHTIYTTRYQYILNPDIQTLDLLFSFYKERGATEEEWQELGKAIQGLASPIIKNCDDSELEHPTVRSRDPNVCARCERADLAEQRRKDRKA